MSATVEFNLGELLGRAFELFKQNAPVLVGATLLTGVVLLLANAVGQYIHMYVATLISMILSGPLMLGLNKMALAAVRGQQVQFGTLFDGFNNAPNAILATLLIWFFVTVGFMCVIVPGVLISALYLPTLLVMADGQSDFWGAMERSRKLTQANFVQWLLVTVISIVLYIGGLVACGIGVLVTAPIALLFIALAYEQQRNAGSIAVDSVVIP